MKALFSSTVRNGALGKMANGPVAVRARGSSACIKRIQSHVSLSVLAASSNFSCASRHIWLALPSVPSPLGSVPCHFIPRLNVCRARSGSGVRARMRTGACQVMELIVDGSLEGSI